MMRTRVTRFGCMTGSHWSEIGFYLIDDLLVDPCAPADGFRDPPIGPTAADLVDELMVLPAYRDSTTTGYTVGGLPATLIVTPQDPFHATVDACDDSDDSDGFASGHIHNPNEVAGLTSPAPTRDYGCRC